MKKQKRLKGMKTAIGQRYYFEPMHGTIKENEAYCTRDQEKEEYETISIGQTPRQCNALHKRKIDEVVKEIKHDDSRKAAIKKLKTATLRPWQKKVVDELNGPADDRKIVR